MAAPGRVVPLLVEPDDAQRIERLERRVQRERAARLEAESIAERGTRELYTEKQRLHLLETIAGASNLSSDVDETLLAALEEVCSFTLWPLGHVFVRDDADSPPTMVSGGLWRMPSGKEYDDFRLASEAIRFPVGVGVPGRVLASKAPAWITDVVQDANFPRHRMARLAGLHACFAFPVLVGGEVAAVLEFFSDKTIDPDEELLRTMAQVGAHLARVIERSRAEVQTRAHTAELERLIEEADAARDAAEAASRAKSAFLAVTSHEVRTPLNAVLGLAEALKREDLTDTQQGLVRGVLDSGEMLLRLLNAVLDLSKVEAGRLTLHVTTFDLRRTVERLTEIWRSRAEELGVALVLDLDGPEGPWPVESDEGKVEQTLVNLLSNALKFSPRGGTVTISGAATCEGGRWQARFDIIDQGPGVAECDRARIFRPFEQTPAGRDAGGAGLGLSICAGNMSLLGGAIGAGAADGGGSRFWFSFDAAAAAMPTVEAPPEPEAVVDDGFEAPALRILAAEDNATNRQVLDLLLRPVGVSLSFVEDGEAAVAAARDEAFDVILMDAHMPRMDGVEAVRAIRALGGAFADLPIYMLTANVFDDDIRRYGAAGADGVLKKPIDVRELYATLEEASERSELRRAAG